MAISTTKLGSNIGVEVHLGVDELLSDGVAAELMTLLEQHGVLVMRDLHLDDDTQRAVAHALGEVEMIPTLTGDKDEIFLVSLDPQKTATAEYLKGTFYWHIDGATDDIPTKATMLSCRAVAGTGGGGTEFASTYAAYDALDDDTKARYRDLKVIHSLEAAQRLTTPDPTDEEVAIWRMRPSKTQPLVWTHNDGRRSLVAGATAQEVVSVDPDESRAILDEVMDQITDPRFCYRHEWTVGDFVIWDNRGTMHRALPYTADSGREMHRCTLVGDEAFA